MPKKMKKYISVTIATEAALIGIAIGLTWVFELFFNLPR